MSTSAIEGSAWRNVTRKITAPVRFLARLLLRPDYRSAYAARLRFGAQAFQGATTTRADRFPVLFRQCALLLQEVRSPRILSFGCSTGAEAATLVTYMPKATVVGVDINSWCLRQCRRKVRDARCTFLHRRSPEFAALGNLNAIFCMAVFQRTEHRVHHDLPIDTGFTFDCFDQEIAMLDAKLMPGGYFFIDHSDFRFEDASVASRYATVDFPESTRDRDRPVFGRNGQRIADRHVVQRCFQKLS